MAKRIQKKEKRRLALESVRHLFAEADKIFSKEPALAHRYVALARKAAMKARLRMPREFKRKFCKHCYHYLRSGKNARIRTREGKLIIYCLECKKFTRIPLKSNK